MFLQIIKTLKTKKLLRSIISLMKFKQKLKNNTKINKSKKEYNAFTLLNMLGK